MRRFTLGSLAFLVAILVTLMFSGFARADSVTYNLDQFGSGIASWNGFSTSVPAGTVTLTQDGSDVDVTVSLSTGLVFYNHGSVTNNVYPAWFMYNTPPLANLWTSYNMSNPNPGDLYTSYGNNYQYYGGSTTGYFDWGVKTSDWPPNSTYSYITFTIDGITTAELATGNGTSIFAAAIDDPGKGENTMVYTTCAATPPTATPEPCTMLLLGLGLAGFAAFRMKFGKA